MLYVSRPGSGSKEGMLGGWRTERLDPDGDTKVGGGIFLGIWKSPRKTDRSCKATDVLIDFNVCKQQ